jgi:hypothetical protein
MPTKKKAPANVLPDEIRGPKDKKRDASVPFGDSRRRQKAKG